MEFTQGIYFNHDLKENETCQITYSGMLFQKGSSAITIVYGFGQEWNYTTEKPMIQNEEGFTVEIEIKNHFDSLHFCFKNEKNEWDNNYSCNYIAPILPISLPLENEISDNQTIQDIDELLNQFFENTKQNTVTADNFDDLFVLDEPEETSDVNFNMSQLIDEILIPIMNTSTKQEEENSSVTFFESGDEIDLPVNISLEESLDTTIAFDTLALKNEIAENTSEEQKEQNTALVETNTDAFKLTVSPRKLRKFYLIRKKIKLALYKALVVIPKLLTGEYYQSKN